MSKRITGSYGDALYKSTYILHFTLPSVSNGMLTGQVDGWTDGWTSDRYITLSAVDAASNNSIGLMMMMMIIIIIMINTYVGLQLHNGLNDQIVLSYTIASVQRISQRCLLTVYTLKNRLSF